MVGQERDIKDVGLIGGVEKRAITIVPYSDQWLCEFRTHADRIQEKLGDVAMRVEHIGSTSVKGLDAKPIIDILVVVADPADEPCYFPAMEGLGYELRVRQPEFDQHRMFRTSDRDVHVHFFPPHSGEVTRYLMFRDTLRSSPQIRARYAALKHRLSRMDWKDMNEYSEAKTEFIEAVISGNFQVGDL